MFYRNVLSWFQEDCPYCGSKLVGSHSMTSHVKSCPNGHYQQEVHPALGVEVQYHTKNGQFPFTP